MKTPTLKVFTGPMFGGKTTKLLAAIERYKWQKKKVVLFKPSIDGRYSREKVVTHAGHELDSVVVSHGDEIMKNVAGADVVAIDELFMIQGAGRVVVDLFLSGKDVIVSSLQLSSVPRSFKEMKDVLPYATSIEVCPAVCSMCDRDAYYTYRTKNCDSEVSIGGAESYEPRCFFHYDFGPYRENL